MEFGRPGHVPVTRRYSPVEIERAVIPVLCSLLSPWEQVSNKLIVVAATSPNETVGKTSYFKNIVKIDF